MRTQHPYTDGGEVEGLRALKPIAQQTNAGRLIGLDLREKKRGEDKVASRGPSRKRPFRQNKEREVDPECLLMPSKPDTTGDRAGEISVAGCKQRGRGVKAEADTGRGVNRS